MSEEDSASKSEDNQGVGAFLSVFAIAIKVLNILPALLYEYSFLV